MIYAYYRKYFPGEGQLGIYVLALMDCKERTEPEDRFGVPDMPRHTLWYSLKLTS